MFVFKNGNLLHIEDNSRSIVTDYYGFNFNSSIITTHISYDEVYQKHKKNSTLIETRDIENFIELNLMENVIQSLVEKKDLNIHSITYHTFILHLMWYFNNVKHIFYNQGEYYYDKYIFLEKVLKLKKLVNFNNERPLLNFCKVLSEYLNYGNKNYNKAESIENIEDTYSFCDWHSEIFKDFWDTVVFELSKYIIDNIRFKIPTESEQYIQFPFCKYPKEYIFCKDFINNRESYIKSVCDIYNDVVFNNNTNMYNDVTTTSYGIAKDIKQYLKKKLKHIQNYE